MIRHFVFNIGFNKSYSDIDLLCYENHNIWLVSHKKYLSDGSSPFIKILAYVLQEHSVQQNIFRIYNAVNNLIIQDDTNYFNGLSELNSASTESLLI